MLHMPNHMLLTGAGSAPPGQVLFTSLANIDTSWIVPDGVTKISVVCIGWGGAAPDTFNSGTGGALRYVNAVPVTPGETLAVRVAPGFVSDIRRGGVPLCSANAGGFSQFAQVGTGSNGGSGTTKTAGQSRPGGGAGGYTSAGSQSSADSGRGGQGIDPYGRRQVGGSAGLSDQPIPTGGLYGGGGGLLYNPGDGSNTQGAGGQGCVRIIWGEVNGVSRAFPNTNTEDVI